MEKQENYFLSWEDWENSEDYDKYACRWIKEHKDLMGMGWRLNVNCAWIEQRFLSGRYDEVYKYLIDRAREYKRRADFLCLTQTDREFVEWVYNENRENLFLLYQKEIYEYCVRK